MNVSQKTRIVAQGIALCAAMMDLPMRFMPGSLQNQLFDDWAVKYPELEEIAKREQQALFDRMLGGS